MEYRSATYELRRGVTSMLCVFQIAFRDGREVFQQPSCHDGNK